MRQDLFEHIIEAPKGVTFKLDGSLIEVQGPKGINKRDLRFPHVSLKLESNILTIIGKKITRKHKKVINTFKSHIINLIKGVTDGYEYQLKVCSSHFPMSVSVKDNQVIVKNYLGGKIPIISKIRSNVNVKINGDLIFVTGIDKESVGQTAANIEKSTIARKKDRRKFQDGCYIINKAGIPI